MKITFIRPNMMPGKAGDALEPLAFSILSSLTPPDIEQKMYDERIESVPLDEDTDLVALSVDTFSARRAYQIAVSYYRRKIPVVMGGPHPTLCTKESLGFARTVVTGDAEDTWPDFVEDARHDRQKRVYSSRFPPLSSMRYDRTVFGTKKYGFIRIVQFGRGCPHECDFCSVHAVYGDQIRCRNTEDVIADIEQAGATVFFFADDNLFANKQKAIALCNALKPLRKKWACQMSLSTARERDLVKLMSESGCVMVIIGFETMNGETLRQMKKEWNRGYGSYDEIVKTLQQEGIMVYGTFVLGYDTDTLDTLKACVEFAIKSKLALANFNPLMPFPGTPLYERLKREQRLLHGSWWLDPDYRYGKAMFRPRNMAPDQLEQSCFEAKLQFNRINNIIGRAWDWNANIGNIGIFLATNFASRREILRKQGAKLGFNENPEPVYHHET